DLLAVDGGVGGTAADREVVTADDHLAALDPAGPEDVVGGRELLQRPVGPVFREPGQPAPLLEAARVEERVDPLADGQPAGVLLPLDALGAAHLPGQLLPPAEFVNLRLPGHAAMLRRRPNPQAAPLARRSLGPTAVGTGIRAAWGLRPRGSPFGLQARLGTSS